MNPCACRIRAIVVIGLLAPVLAACHRGERVLDSRPPARYLMCDQTGATPPAFTHAVGEGGATLVFHGDTVVIPSHNVPPNQTWQFTLSRPAGDSVGIHIRSEPPARFRRSATVVIDASRCSTEEWGSGDWSIWRNGRQRLMTDVTAPPRRARALIDSTSSFMIAN